MCDRRGHHQDWTVKTPRQCHEPKDTNVLSIFEKLTLGFGVPKSDEIDPTVLWLVTYPLFFGFMFGDVGNGFVVMLFRAIFSCKEETGLTHSGHCVRWTWRRFQHGHPRLSIANP